MTRIVFEPDEEQPPARLQEALHRKALLKDAIARLGDVVAQSDANFRSDAEWYVAVLLDGLLRGALVVEFREWTGHCEDLLRDQLSRQGRDRKSGVSGGARRKVRSLSGGTAGPA